MKDLFSLAGKTALITGGSVGIGAMIAEGFVNFGARVYLAARREEALKRKRDELAAIGSSATPTSAPTGCWRAGR